MTALLPLLLAAPAAHAAPADPLLPTVPNGVLAARLAWEAGVQLERLDPRLGADAEGLHLVLESDAPAATAAWAEDRGYTVEAAAGGLVQVRLPWRDLDAVGQAPGLVQSRLPHLARSAGFDGGAEQTEGLGALPQLEAWHAAGLDGRTVRVAVLDVGFEDWTTRLGVELPADTRGSNLEPPGETAHGVAVAEIIADVAPGARLHLHRFTTDVEFVALLERLSQDGTDVVNASIGFDNIWHPDGTSPMSEAVDQLARAGVAYVAAAGNEVGRYRSGPLGDGDGDGDLDIDGETGLLVEAPGGDLRVSLRWSEEMDAATWDLDLYAWPDVEAWAGGAAPCAASTEPQGRPGDAPLESIVGWCGSGGSAWVVPVLASPGDGDLADLEAHVYAPFGYASGEDTVSRTLTLPADAVGAITVGACEVREGDYAEGGAADRYSSRGPTDDGRLKPDLCAAAAVTTASFGERGFVGTSAAAPHVAGAVALILDGEGLHGAPDAARVRLTRRATDLGDPGADPRYGAGGLRLGEPAARCRCGTTPGASWALPFWLVLGITSRRRRPVADGPPRRYPPPPAP